MPASPTRFHPRLLLLCCILCASALLTSCNNTKLRLEQAQNLEKQELWGPALLAYNELLPKVSHQKTQLLADIYSRMGHCLIELDRGNEALAVLEKAEGLDPSSPAMHLRMAQLLVMAD